MIACLTKALLALQIIAIIAFFFLLRNIWHDTHNLLIIFLSVSIVLVLRFLITLNSFYFAWLYRTKKPAAQELDWIQIFRLVWNEFSATILSSTYTMPFCRFKKCIVNNPLGLPVLLIHGYGCNSGYWHPLSKKLLHAGIAHHTIDMEPVFAGIDDYVPLVQQAIVRLCDETGNDRIIILAHSMGGLVVRAYLRTHGNSHIARVITLGTPHHGTVLANCAIGVNSKQMRRLGRFSPEKSFGWLMTLAQSEKYTNYALFTSIYSLHDNIIAPQSSCALPGAINIPIQGIGHVGLAIHPTCQKLILNEIKRAH